jgi:hypothetical protein
MIWILLSAIVPPSQSIAAGAASLSDSSIILLFLILCGGKWRLVALGVGDRVACRASGSILADDEVAQDLLRDEEAALQLGDRGRGRLEDHDVVRAFSMAVDGIGEPPAAPRGDLHDLAAVGGDLAGGAIDDRPDAVVRRLRTEDQHELVAAHGR